MILEKQNQKLDELRAGIDRHETYFETFAASISLLTENLNMQMEGEFADIRDRGMMGLYGTDSSKPEVADHSNSSKFVEKYNKHKETESDKNVANDFVSIDVPTANQNQNSNKSIQIANPSSGNL